MGVLVTVGAGVDIGAPAVLVGVALGVLVIVGSGVDVGVGALVFIGATVGVSFDAAVGETAD
jgi:hypothetical protein